MYATIQAHPTAVKVVTTTMSSWLVFSGEDERTTVDVNLAHLPPKVAAALLAAAQSGE